MKKQAALLRVPLTEAFEILDPQVEDPIKLIEAIARRCRTTPAVVKEWLIEEVRRMPIRPLTSWGRKKS